MYKTNDTIENLKQSLKTDYHKCWRLILFENIKDASFDKNYEQFNEIQLFELQCYRLY